MNHDQYNIGLTGLRGDRVLPDSTCIGLLIVIEARASFSKNIEGFFNFVLNSETRSLPPLVEHLFSLASKEQPAQRIRQLRADLPNVDELASM
jgi:hypothetical protein